jgi:DNA-directed RNA polymerase I, II, and III subunit RPABC5
MKIEKGVNVDRVIYLTKKNIEKTAEGIVLDELGLYDPCCRRHMLTHVDIE